MLDPLELELQAAVSGLTWVTSAIFKSFGKAASTQLLRHLSSPAKDLLKALVSFFLGRQNDISEHCLPPILANFPSCKAGVRCLGNVKSLQNSLQAITSEWNIATAKTGFNSFSFYFKVITIVLRFPLMWITQATAKSLPNMGENWLLSGRF